MVPQTTGTNSWRGSRTKRGCSKTWAYKGCKKAVNHANVRLPYYIHILVHAYVLQAEGSMVIFVTKNRNVFYENADAWSNVIRTES